MRPPIELRNSNMVTLLGTVDAHSIEDGRSGGCAYAFQSEYIRGHEADPGEAATDGICFHATAAIYGRWLSRYGYSGRLPHHRRRLLDILEDQMKRHGIDGDRAVALREMGEFFGGTWKFDRDATHIFEQRWFFTLDWQEIPAQRNRPVAKPESDYIGMTLDHLWYKPTPREVTFVDFKTGDGARGLDYSEDAKHNEQLQIYARGVLAKFPECERVTARIWGLKGGSHNISEYEFARGSVEQIVDERIAEAVSRLDSLWGQHRNNDWPATGDHSAACRYCSVPGGCPRLKDIFEVVL